MDARAVWSDLCRLMTSAALGPVIETLDRRGALALLAESGGGIDVDVWAARCGLRPGMARLAARWLEITGRARRAGNGSRCVTPTATTRSSPAPDPHASMTAIMALVALDRAGALDPGHPLGCRDTLLWQAEIRALGAVGWGGQVQGLWRLTDAGRIAARLAPQLTYVAGYRALLDQADGLLAGQGPVVLPRTEDGSEGHVDRAADIAFSGLVFTRTCGPAFLDLALRCFDKGPAGRPSVVVDTGAGDGSLLMALHAALREACPAGPMPLLIAIEYNEIARATASRRLAAAGIDHLAIAGDIGDPQAIAACLSGHGVDAADALHVSKSVIHNRTVSGLAPDAPDDPVFAASRAVHLDQKGRPLHARAMAGDLIAWFDRWAPLCRRHGMIAVEAHVASPQAIAAAGPSPVAATEITHGLSLQHLVEIGFHRRAYALAGWRAEAQVDLQAGLLGEPLMSCDHLVPENRVPGG